MVAYVANNAVPRADLPALFEGLHASLKRLADGEVAPPVVEPPTPVVPVRKSVTPDYLICLDDGKRFKSLRRHLGGPRNDAGAVSPEVESAQRLSHGRAELRGATIGTSEEHRVWAAREAPSPPRRQAQ